MRRSSSSPTPSPSTRTRRSTDPWANGYSSPGSWAASARGSRMPRSRTASEVIGYDLGENRQRLRLVLGRRRRARDARPRRHHRPRTARAGAGRARGVARRPPGCAPGAVRPRRPAARDARQRRRHRQRLRVRRAAARSHPRAGVRELDRRLQPLRPLARARVGRHRADDAVRRLEARRRGNGPRLRGGSQASRRSACGRTSSTGQGATRA